MVCATAGTCAVATTRARPRPADSEAAAPAAEAEAENTGRQRCRDVARCGFLQHVRSWRHRCWHTRSLFILRSRSLPLYLCGHLFSVDVTRKWILLNCFNFGASTRVVSLQSDVTVRHVACGALTTCVCVCANVCGRVCTCLVCAPELLSLTLRKYWNTLCRYRPNRVASFDTKQKNTHLLHAQIKFLLLLWMSIKRILSVQVVINLIWVREAHTQEPAYGFASVIAKSID